MCLVLAFVLRLFCVCSAFVLRLFCVCSAFVLRGWCFLRRRGHGRHTARHSGGPYGTARTIDADRGGRKTRAVHSPPDCAQTSRSNSCALASPLHINCAAPSDTCCVTTMPAPCRSGLCEGVFGVSLVARWSARCTARRQLCGTLRYVLCDGHARALQKRPVRGCVWGLVGRLMPCSSRIVRRLQLCAVVRSCRRLAAIRRPVV